MYIRRRRTICTGRRLFRYDMGIRESLAESQAFLFATAAAYNPGMCLRALPVIIGELFLMCFASQSRPGSRAKPRRWALARDHMHKRERVKYGIWKSRKLHIRPGDVFI